MKKIFTLILGAVALASCSSGVNEEILGYVNPNIGTVHSRWFVYTPASVPFGMAKLGASTNGTYGNVQGWEAVGYEDTHTSIDGFPCFHEFQVGGLSLMPVNGEVKTTPARLENPQDGWRSTFDKSDEEAHPGYYSVLLKDYGIRAELTATKRVGFQRYTFPASESSHIIFNVGNREGESGNVRDSYAVCEGNVVSGYIVTEPEYVKKYQAGATVCMYFYATLSKAPESVSGFQYYGSELKDGNSIQGPGAVLVLNFKTVENEQVDVKLGLSYTSVENAKANYMAEAENLSFDNARRSAAADWSEQLSRIEVKGGSEDSRIKFYTGLYHCLLGRGLASDVNGAYPKNDGTVGQIELGKDGKPVHNHYNTDAIWGGYWNLTPLWALAYPEYYNDWCASQLLVYKDAGWLGDGIACSKYVSGVGTNMVSIALAGAYNSGIRDFDIETMYAAARKDNLEWRDRIEGAGKMDVRRFVEDGYVPYVDDPGFVAYEKGATFSVSHTLEYSFSAYATAQLAKQLGHEEDYRQLMSLTGGQRFSTMTSNLSGRECRVVNGLTISTRMSLGEVSRKAMRCSTPSSCLRIRILSLREWVRMNSMKDLIRYSLRPARPSSAVARWPLPSPVSVARTITATSRAFTFLGSSISRASRILHRNGQGLSVMSSTARTENMVMAMVKMRIKGSSVRGMSWQQWACSMFRVVPAVSLPISSEVRNSMRLQFI